MDKIVDYYNQLAKSYDGNRFENSYGKFIDHQERSILQQLLTNQKDIVLDMPCGSGRFMNFAQIGVDASAEMIQVAREKFPDKTYHQASADHTGLENESIDVVICFHFFMHLNAQRMELVLNECERILNKNGRIIFDIPSAKRRKAFGYKGNDWHGSFSLSRKEITKMTSRFEIRRSFGILFIPIHRIPNKLRPLFRYLDHLLANSFLKPYSSYQIFELVKK